MQNKWFDLLTQGTREKQLVTGVNCIRDGLRGRCCESPASRNTGDPAWIHRMPPLLWVELELNVTTEWVYLLE